MKLLQRAARESTVVRMALAFVVIAIVVDAFATLLVARVTVLFTLFALVYLGIVLAGFAQGAQWARDPVIATVGRAPESSQEVAGARVTSRTERLPLESWMRDVLMSEARRQSREGRAWVVVGSCFVLGGALFVAVQAGDPILFAAAVLLVFIPASFIWMLAGPPTSADAEWGDMYRTEGPVRLSWLPTRGGRMWDVRVGDRRLRAWDDVGSRLAHMPWGVVEYTASGRILRVRDIDGNTIYELRAQPDSPVSSYALRLGPLFLVCWVILALVIRFAR